MHFQCARMSPGLFDWIELETQLLNQPIVVAYLIFFVSAQQIGAELNMFPFPLSYMPIQKNLGVGHRIKQRCFQRMKCSNTSPPYIDKFHMQMMEPMMGQAQGLCQLKLKDVWQDQQKGLLSSALMELMLVAPWWPLMDPVLFFLMDAL